MENKNKRKKTRKVIRMPGWILQKKGKWDSAHGESVCDAYLKHMDEKCAAAEADLVIAVEKELYESRKNAAVQLEKLADCQAENRKKDPDEQRNETAAQIRAGRKREERRREAGKKRKETKEKLTAIEKRINNKETVLEEEILRIRRQTAEKKQAYICGVRRGKLKDYAPKAEEPDDAAKIIYWEKHRELRELMKQALNTGRKGGEKDEEGSQAMEEKERNDNDGSSS